MLGQLKTVEQIQSLLTSWERAARDHTEFAQQSVLLGLNAAINYDLVFELASVLAPECDTLTPAGRARDRRAFDAMIAQLKRLILEVYTRVANEITLALEPWMLDDVIDGWAETVWKHSDALLRSHSAFETEAIRFQVERRTAKRADAIRRAGARQYSRQIA